MTSRPLLIGLCVAMAVTGAFAQRRGGRGREDGGGRGRSASLQASVMVKHEIKDAAKRGALCNDGLPAAFYFRPGKDPDRNKWIVFLQGGGGCGSDASCQARWKDEHNLMSAAGLPPQRREDGLLSDDADVNPDFGKFSMAVVHYCSSDAYAGETERGVAGQKLLFHGRRIVDAVFDDLMDKSVVGSPTLRDATEVLFAGSSAGSFGVHNNADRIAARLTWAKTKALLDSGWVPDVKPFGPGTMDVRPDAAEAFAYVNGQPDEPCAGALRQAQGGPAAAASCFRQQVVWEPLARTSRRRAATRRNCGRIVDEYGRLVRESMAALPAAFSASVGQHTALASERFRTITVDGHPLSEIVARWYFGRPGPMNLIAPASSGRGRRGR